MDTDLLVKAGHLLVSELDKAGPPPRAALWVQNTETRTWKLWIVLATNVPKDPRDFYRQMSTIVTKHRAELGGIDASDTEIIPEAHPVISQLRENLRLEGLSKSYIHDTYFNGYYLPAAIILRMAV